MLVGLPESFPHGTRSAYVRGCRCRPCKDSNNAYYHARQKRAKALAAAAPPSPRPPDPQPQTWTAPDGTKQIRTYRRACAGWVGPAGDGCPWKSHLRKDSTGDLCRRCRERLVWNGLVPTATIVGRIRFASTEWGIGYKTYADAAGERPDRQWAYYHVQRMCDLAAIPVVSPHGLRGLQSTISRMDGATAHQVAAQLGHASVSMQDAYVDRVQVEAAQRRQAFAVLTGGRR